MHLRKKKRLGIIIAAFAMIFLVGSAFAALILTPVVIQGTADFGTSLRLAIVGYDVSTTGTLVYPGDVKVTLTDEVSGRPQLGHKTATFEIDFTTPGQTVIFDFLVQNVGVADIEVFNVTITDASGNLLPAPGPLVPVYFLTEHYYEPSSPIVILPGDSDNVNVTAVFNPDYVGTSDWEITGTETYKMEIHYRAATQ